MAYITRAFVEVADQGHGVAARAGRLMFASDHPFLPLERVLPAARQPSLPAEALDDFPGNPAARVLKLVC
jgi:predicted TIM-barrel fold metal-dependent hydrolase